ncbi:MAG: alternative ribosome rescue aminoacyl-tRNA hydrolase ArfB [Thermodesulfobacteriota bacterium]|nr:alternative ribosome rescue aminoacyl-tRNA hydrolase ArfB [Thermodesulfobacteriota bacterium]
MIRISNNVTIAEYEVVIKAVRAQGAGGQNVNKVSTAITLFFDIPHSSLPSQYKTRLLQLSDRRITKQGVVVIKAQQHRSQEMNRAQACQRLQHLVQSVMVVPKKRTVTKPSRSARKKRMDRKTLRGRTKVLRGKVRDLS